MKKSMFSLLLLFVVLQVQADGQNTVITAEQLVDKQIVAYNNGDIDAFMATYTEDVKLFNYPNKEITSGFLDMKIMYQRLFKNNPNLKAKVTNKIIEGGVLIYHEQITGLSRGGEFNAIAIYEVIGSKISKVTFIQ